MIQLYNTHTNSFINLCSDQRFNIEATNQMQDLKSYCISYSFDIEAVTDSTLMDALNYQSRVILYKDSQPLFIGTLALLASYVDRVKLTYRAVPYGPAFESFTFRQYLKDYLAVTTYEQNPLQIRNILEGTYFNIYRQRGGIFHLHHENGAPAYQNSFMANLKCDKIENGRFVNLQPDYSFKSYWGSMPVNDLLAAIGIRQDSADNDLQCLCPVTVSYKRKIRVRLYRKLWGRGGAVMKYHEYVPTSSSEIWWDKDGSWEKLGGNTMYGVQASVFNESIRKLKGLKGLTLLSIDMPYDYVYGKRQYYSLNTTSVNCMQSLDFDVPYGKTYEDDESMQFHMTPAYAGAIVPDYVDAVFMFECTCDQEKFKREYSYRNLYKNVPMRQEDISIFSMKTEDFLNGISLSCKSMKKLRNPSFVTEGNYKYIHGMENARLYDVRSFHLDARHLESISKSVDWTAHNSVKYVQKGSCPIVYEKPLNTLQTEAEEIESGFSGGGLTYNMPTHTEGYPNLIYDDENKKWVDNGLVCCFGTIDEAYDSTAKKTVRRFHPDQDSDFDFMKNLSSQHEVYELVCIGYNRQETIEFEGKTFAVLDYRTSDFEKYTIHCVQITPLPEEHYDDPEFEPVSFRTSTTGGRMEGTTGRPVRRG